MSVNDKREWEIALRGLKRFFDEGMAVWPREKFDSLFSSKEVANSHYVLEALKSLELQGAIILVGTDDLYIRIIRI
ncbi:hypothetical protein LCGC14_0192520 [marine sediment metagenome]|uniref:Uncharacterized protein n=1 Tax=marine sediment metagenome TaxID=412755 RepID=A0A0F9XNY9_9ZZZZ